MKSPVRLGFLMNVEGRWFHAIPINRFLAEDFLSRRMTGRSPDVAQRLTNLLMVAKAGGTKKPSTPNGSGRSSKRKPISGKKGR